MLDLGGVLGMSFVPNESELRQRVVELGLQKSLAGHFWVLI